MIAFVFMLAQADPSDVTLTSGGILIMSLSILLVMGLMGFCMYRIIRNPDNKPHDAE